LPENLKNFREALPSGVAGAAFKHQIKSHREPQKSRSEKKYRTAFYLSKNL